MNDHITYFVYHSAPKIEMLYSQLCQRDGKVKGEVGINLGLKVGVTYESQENTIQDKLQSVKKHILGHEDVGPLNAPYTYYFDTNVFHFGVSGGVMFLLNDHSLLVGSECHMLGSERIPQTVGGSHLSAALGVFGELFGRQLDPEFRPQVANPISRKELENSLPQLVGNLDCDHSAAGRGGAFRAPKMRLEVLAKGLLIRNGYVFATPIYVAIA